MFLDTATMKIDRSEFELVPEARHTTSAGALNIRASGEIILNKRLLQNILRRTDSLRLGFACHKEDKGLLLLFVTDKPNYTFPAGGMKLHAALHACTTMNENQVQQTRQHDKI